MAAEHDPAPTRRHRPRAATVFIAAFVAGAAAAVGINRVLDVHLAQSKPQVECEPIFVALRSLPQGVPVTVWDVALRDWPKAMMPTAAVRVNDTFAGCLLKHPLREGQPLLTVQLLPPAIPVIDDEEDEAVEEMFVPPVPATVAVPPPATATLIATTAPAVTPVAETKTDAATVETSGDQTGTTGTEPERTESEHVAAAETAVDDVVEAVIETVVPPTAEPEIVATVNEPTIEPTTVASDAEAEAGMADPATVATAAVPAEAQAQPQSAEPESQPVLTAEQLTAAPPATNPPSPPVAEPVVAAAPQPSLARIRQEPTPAAEPPLVPVATAPSPTAIGPHLLGQPAAGSQGVGRAAMDLPSRPAADVASMPSVIARGEDSAAVSVAETADSSARYLVVPERIAQQADTSFTTPSAPAAPTVARATTDERPEPAQQAAAVRRPGPRPSTGRQAGTPPAANRGSRTATGRNTATAKQPQAAQPKPADRAATESSSWGSMFPNVSAGIEAIGKWRTRGREAVADEDRDPQPRR